MDFTKDTTRNRRTWKPLENRLKHPYENYMQVFGARLHRMLHSPFRILSAAGQDINKEADSETQQQLESATESCKPHGTLR